MGFFAAGDWAEGVAVGDRLTGTSMTTRWWKRALPKSRQPRRCRGGSGKWAGRYMWKKWFLDVGPLAEEQKARGGRWAPIRLGLLGKFAAPGMFRVRDYDSQAIDEALPSFFSGSLSSRRRPSSWLSRRVLAAAAF
ncbi:MAG: hypothetical protein NVS2B15_03220 [Pseudarthrobacter sp.]